MARLSAGSFKKGYYLQSLPREGTRVRVAYDWFLANPLTPICIHDMVSKGFCANPYHHWGNLKEKLEEYGLYITQFKVGWWWLTSTDVRDYFGERFGPANGA